MEHMQFWSQLTEDQPDLDKLHEFGKKINVSLGQIEDTWQSILKNQTNLTKPLKLYGQFLMMIINNKEKGEELLLRAKGLSTLKNTLLGDEEVDKSRPMIGISMKPENMGEIISINVQAASLFGYNKSELIGKKWPSAL